jgi:hypothetical protein
MTRSGTSYHLISSSLHFGALLSSNLLVLCIETYSFGDVTKAVVSSIKTNQLNAVNKSTGNNERLLLGSVDGKMEQSVVQALDTWDKFLSERDELKTNRAKLERYVAFIEKEGGS